ncbi:MAG: ATP-grasp domain-containing protein [Parafannyhessea umbonata]|nr:ATP-grasp domain-containing protein [Parafannyhessea umbonata]
MVVGGLGVVRARLLSLGVDASEIDYPEELRPFLGRRLWKTTVDHVSTEVGTWPLFVKPVEGKRFTGCVVADTRDLIGKGCCGEDFPVICSEVVDFVSEYRCFVRRGGDPRRAPLPR